MFYKAYEELGISKEVYKFGEKIIDGLKERFDKIDKTAEYNQCKVLAAMKKNRVDVACFAASTGYGYNDLGRDKIERVYADTFRGGSRPPADSLRHARAYRGVVGKSFAG